MDAIKQAFRRYTDEQLRTIAAASFVELDRRGSMRYRPTPLGRAVIAEIRRKGGESGNRPE